MRLDQESIVLRFNSLIEAAALLAVDIHNQGGKFDAVPLSSLRASSRHLLTLLLPGSRIYLDELFTLDTKASGFNPAWYQGVLTAAKQDFISGLIGDPKLFICAEVFTDFLQQAEYLNNEGYKDPAAVIAGTVLEDGLRRLCDLKNVERGDRDTINVLNTKLYKASIYTKLWMEEVTAKAVVRNDAAHGKYDGYGKADVDNLIRFTRDFLREFLPSTP